MPQTFLQDLDRIAERVRGRALATAVAWVVAAAVGGATLLVVIDWIGRFTDPGLRWLFTGALVATVVGAVLVVRKRFLRGRVDRLGVARRVESLHPGLGSRLASAVEFVDQESDDLSAGSAELRRAVVHQVASETEGLDLEGVIDQAPLRKASRAVVAAVVPALLLALLAWPSFSLGVQRLVAPWAGLDWPRRNVLRLVEPVESIAAGARFEAVATDLNRRLPDDVRIEYRFTATDEKPARVESQAMRLVGDQAVAEREDVRVSFSYRVVGGDDQTMPWVRLEVHDPPSLIALEVRATAPEYTGLAEAVTGGGPLRVLEGTRIALLGEANEPLVSAAVEITGEEPIGATVQAAAESSEETLLLVGADDWVANLPESGAQDSRREYTVVLENERGLEGRSVAAPYRVAPDEPPRVVWTGSTGDTFVTARALVPVRASVEDNLAVSNAAMRWRESATALEGDEAAPDTPEGERTMYEGAASPPPRASLDEGDRLTIEEEWDLAPHGFAPGVRLDLVVQATDYKPQSGVVELPRRIFVITDEEFELRLSDKQSLLLAEVQRALEAQRAARETATELHADLQRAAELDRAALDRLTSLTYQQRQATSAVDDPTAGAAELARRLEDELRRNRLDRPELLEHLGAASEGLRALATETMPEAGRAAASARRAAESGAPPESAVTALAEAQQHQGEAVEGLEAIAERLTGWSDFQRFAREVAQLQAKQQELAAAAAEEAASASDDFLRSTQRQAQREKLVAEQAETRRRFETLRRAMQGLLESSQGGSAASPENPPGSADESANDGATNAVSDALDEAAESDVAGAMRDASRDLALGRMGSASGRQQQAAEGLGKMLEALRDRASTDPEELVKRLREALEELAEMEQEAADLAQQNSPRGDAEQLSRQAGRMGRRLGRLSAAQAGGSAQQASDSLQQGAESEQSGGQQEFKDAQQSLADAQRQVQQRIDGLNEETTQRALDRLKQKMPDLVARQQRVFEETVALEQTSLAERADRLPQVRRASQGLSGDQEMLRSEVSAAAEEVASRAVFELALRSTEDLMRRASGELGALRLGLATQRLEHQALERLKHIEEVLQENQRLQEQQEQGGGQSGGGGGGQSPPPSPIDVAELKMLRLMQLDLLARTDAFEADAAEARKADPNLPPEWGEEAGRLAGEQRRLAELALELATRDNDPDAPPAAEEGEDE